MEFFADRNADISIVEMMDQIGRDLDPVSKNDTKTMMKKHNVHQPTKTALLEVKDSSFLVRGDGEPYELPFEYGFVCLGMRAQGQLYQNLTEEFSSEDVEIMNIGDSQRARRIIDGTQEGRNILTILEQKGLLLIFFRYTLSGNISILLPESVYRSVTVHSVIRNINFPRLPPPQPSGDVRSFFRSMWREV